MNNELQTVNPGDLYRIDDRDFRVFYAGEGMIGLICMSETVIKTIHVDEFFESLKKGTCRQIESPPSSVPDPELTEEEREKINTRALVLNELIEDMYPDWEDLCRHGHLNPYVRQSAEKLGLSVKHFRLLLYRYMRSGLDTFSLIDERTTRKFRKQNTAPSSVKMIDEKTGVVDKNYALEWAWEAFKNTPNVMKVYEDMLDEFYTKYEWETLPGGGMRKTARIDDRAPKKDAVYRYIQKRLPKGETVKDYKNGQREWQNNHRPLTGTGRSGLISCGQRAQVDECEFDVELRDENGNIIGKPIVYCMFDPYAQIIVSLWIGFSNNSMDGLVNLLLSMCEPHENQTKVCGVDCTDEEFPSQFLPKEILCDQGAEYMSNHMKETAGELGIMFSPVSAATGSNKGGVESVFHRLQSRLQKLLYSKGYIHSKHNGAGEARETAVLSLEGFKTICYQMVIELNTSLIGDTYAPDRDALEAGVKPVPSELWKFYTEGKIAPTAITERNRTRIIYSLLWRDRKFKVSRKGIECIGTDLCWFDNSDWFRDLMYSTAPSFEVRYDKTDISHVYVKYRDLIHQITFSPAQDALNSYKGWTWPAYEDYWKQYKKTRKEEKAHTQEKRLATLHASKEIVQNEEAARGKKEKIKSADSISSARALKRAQEETSPDEARNRLLNVHQKEVLPEEKAILEEENEADTLTDSLSEKSAIDFTEDDLLAMILAQEDDD